MLLFALLFFLMGWLPWQQLQQEHQHHRNNLLQRTADVSAQLLQRRIREADFSYQSLVADQTFLRQLNRYNRVANGDQAFLRRSMSNQLQPLFQQMLRLGISQFQLQDQNGKSVLRLHQPTLFGDPVSHFRPVVAKVAKQQQIFRGYEADRWFAGYRNIYPLLDNGQFVGSLEIGFSPQVLVDGLRASFSDAQLFFLVNQSHMRSDYFEHAEDNYRAVSGVEGFLRSAQVADQNDDQLRRFIGKHPTQTKQALQQGQPAALHDDGFTQSLIFYPIFDYQGLYVASIVILMPDPFIEVLVAGFRNQIVVGFIVLSLLMFFLIWAYHQRNNVAVAYRQLALALTGGRMKTWDLDLAKELITLSGDSQLDLQGVRETRLYTLQQWLESIHPDDRADIARQLKQSDPLQDGDLALEFRYRYQDDWRWCAAMGQVIERDSKGAARLLSGVYQDISKQKTTQLALQHSEQKYRALFSSNKAIELIIDMGQGGAIVDANQAAVEFYGYSLEQLLTMKIDQINCLSPEQVVQEMQRAHAEQRSHFHFVHRLASGELRDVEVHSGPVVLADGGTCLYSIIHDVTDRMRAQAKLVASEARFSSLFECSIDGIVMVNEQGIIEYWNPAASSILGITSKQVLGEGIDWQCFEELDVGWLLRQYKSFKSGRQPELQRCLRTMRLTRGDGVKIWLEVALSGFVSDEQMRFVAILRDVTERKRQQKALERANIAFENAMEGIVVSDANNRIVSVNKAVENISGYSRAELLGNTPSIFSSGQSSPEFYQQMWQTIETEGCWQGEISNRHKTGRIYTEWLNINAVRDESGLVSNYVAVFSDISDLKASRERLDYLAHHDVLTGLPNRLVFKDQLEQAIKRARRSNNPMAVLFIDLDRFKQINDNLGHDVGDELLIEVSRILLDQVRETDTVVRLGGDEFSILFEDWLDMEILARRAGRLIDEITKPILTNSGHELRVGASIGISIYPQDATDSTALVKYADIAMYRAKELGKGRFEFYSAEMTENVRQRFGLETALDEALDSDQQITTVYQPQINLVSGEICGLEALVRWQHPERGVVGPDQFIPIAEDNGMIHRIGQRVTELALKDFNRLREECQFSGKMAINISVTELERDGFGDQLLDLCQLHGVFDAIELEVTETSLGRQPEKFFQRLRSLSDQGFPVAIDDFGTGHSTLARLKQCPSDYLKIDKTFVQDLPEDQDDLVIARSIMSLGQSLGQQVIAEGIETEEQARLLASMGCDIGQGYFFSRPLPYDELVTFIRQWQPFNAQRSSNVVDIKKADH